MNAEMRLPHVFFLAILIACPRCIFGQRTPTPANDPQAFCRHDPRDEVRAFCKSLGDLLAAVTAEKSVASPTLTPDNPQFTDALNKLDITDSKALYKFISATAASLATKTAVADALRTADQARLDQQLGTSSKASGTTSLVSKAGSAELLSLALDTGVLTRSVSGTTSTMSTNGDQVFRLITGSDPDCIVNCNSLGWVEDKLLNRTTLSASFDLAQPNSKTAPTSGQASGTTPTPVSNVAIPTGAGRLSSVTARYQLRNRFDPRSDKFKAAWKEQVGSLAGDVKVIGTDTAAVLDILKAREPFSLPDSQREEYVKPAKADLVGAAASDPSGAKLKDAFEKFWSQVTPEALNDPKLAPAVAKVMQDRAVYRSAWFAALNNAVGNLLTVEYTYNRPLSQPETHDLKLILGRNFGTRGMLTFNGAASFYGGTIPAGAKYGRLRDGQISGQYDRTLSGKSNPIQTQLSLAGYWQYQPNPSVLNIPAGTVVPGTTIPLPNGTQEFVGTAGSLWVTQAKVTIKGSGGINIPVAVSWSNKTDLLQGSRVGAQVGISYNFSSLATLFGGSGGSQ